MSFTTGPEDDFAEWLHPQNLEKTRSQVNVTAVDANTELSRYVLFSRFPINYFPHLVEMSSTMQAINGGDKKNPGFDSQ